MVEALRYSRKVLNLFLVVSLEFFIHLILPDAIRLWGRPTSNTNEYLQYFLGSKGSLCIRLTTLPPLRADCLKSGSLSLLQPKGPYRNFFTFIGISRYTRVSYCRSEESYCARVCVCL